MNVLIAFPRSRGGHTVKRFLIFCLLLASGAAAVRGQSAVDGFDPNANGIVLTVAAQSDGKVLIGGVFTTLAPNGGAPVTRNRIARLNSDGTLDTAFDPNADGDVNTIVLQSNGKILVGGNFTMIGGQARNRMARLNANGTLDTAFNPNANGIVNTIAVQADGKILAGGAFNGVSSIGGQTRNYIARLNATTGAADSFNPNASYVVYAIALQADGKILVGGLFNGTNSIGGQTRNYIARLVATTGAADSFNPNANAFVFRIVVQPDGRIVVAGAFNGTPSIGGQTRNRIARLNGDGTVDSAFDPNADGNAYALAVQPDGRILAGGLFANIGGETRNHIARLDAVTGAPDCFDPNPNGSNVYALAVQGDGKILAGGDFTNIVGAVRNHIARLEEYTPSSCTPGAPGCGWQQGDMRTATQAGWDSGTAANTLAGNFSMVYGAGALVVGGNFTMGFTSAGAVFAYLPAFENAATLTGNHIDPMTTEAGELGGEVLALQLNVDFSAIFGNTVPLRSLRICNFSTVPSVNGQTVDQFLTTANWILGGGAAAFGPSTATLVATLLNNAFVDGTPSAFAQQNLFVGFCPCTLQITAAVSRKHHGGAGDFDIPLPLAGQPGVECRSSSGAHTLVFSFSKNVVSGNASVTSGTGGVSGNPTFSGNTMTVNLTGVADVQKITVTLSGITDRFGQVLPNTAVSVGVLVGDVNGSGVVTSGDTNLCKGQALQMITTANFRNDINASGAITTGDANIIKQNALHQLPP